MFNPPHPGSILKEDVLPELGISVTEAAAQLGLARETFSRTINGKSAISVDVAIRLEAWLSKPTAESWLHMQAEYDLRQARQSRIPRIELIKPVEKPLLIKSVLINLPADEKPDKDLPIIDKAERAITNLVGLQLKKARSMFGIDTEANQAT
jgi:addiction module HigA family antidote